MFDTATDRASSTAVVVGLDEYFERRHPSVTTDSAALVDRICASTRAENRVAAAQLVAIRELFGYRLSRCSDTEDWAVDTEESVAAEVAAALRISQGMAGSRLRYARAMHERLPRVGDVFAAGDIDMRTFKTIVFRTELITDPDVLRAVDAELAVGVSRWPSMTQSRLAGQIDKIVARADADAVRRRRERHAGRELSIWDSGDGLAEVFGRLMTVDAHAVDARLDALAASVCPDDPRTRDQRRADALGAMAAGADRLRCRCGQLHCPAAMTPAPAPVLIHLIAEQATLDGHTNTSASEVRADGLIGPELVSELAATARVTPLVHPLDAAPERGYVPSKALADFVRCRDLTCRWPGCDRPAFECDLDHTVPYGDGGPTHASNLKCYCRAHHLVKTFWGWRDNQLPDGTIILTSPSGRTYVTTPGSALLFPSLCRPTGELPARAPARDNRCGQRTAMMPKRRRTRAQDRAQRVSAERRQNALARTARQANRPRYFTPAPPGGDDDPPPF
jgi:hypothetical protein